MFEYDEWPMLFTAVELMQKIASEHQPDDEQMWQALKDKVCVLACREFPEIDWDAVSLVCPVCDQITNVYHFHWEAITCATCENMVRRSRWKLYQAEERELPF